MSKNQPNIRKNKHSVNKKQESNHEEFCSHPGITLVRIFSIADQSIRTSQLFPQRIPKRVQFITINL